jgi:hypothetical protein
MKQAKKLAQYLKILDILSFKFDWKGREMDRKRERETTLRKKWK